MKHILKVVVGSQAHGLATKDSDFDYRGVFLEPTVNILKLGGSVKSTSWIEGKDDDTSWELGHFLNMAVHSNPTILEVFLSPWSADGWKESLFFHDGTSVGSELKNLFPYVWSSKGVRDAFIGYGHNQRKKMLEEKDARPHKYAVAYLRTLYNAHQLLTTGTFQMSVVDTPIYDTLKAWKAGNFSHGEVVDTCRQWQRMVEEAYEANPNKQTDIDKINEFLLRVRKEFWEDESRVQE